MLSDELQIEKLMQIPAVVLMVTKYLNPKEILTSVCTLLDDTCETSADLKQQH